jgi:hypothetical protein
MGIEARYTASITKACDGCGERWEASSRFSSVAGVLAFGGPVEAADWEIHISPEGRANLLCGKCAEHVRRD